MNRHKLPLSLFGLLVAAGMIGYFSLYTLQENELAIITKFGKPVRIVKDSGLHPKLPGILETVNRFDKRADLFETTPTQLLLGDKKPIIIGCSILWKIDDPLLFFQSMGQAETAVQRIGDIINSKLSIVLSDYSIENIINIDAEKVLLADIEARVTADANENTIKKYGVEIQKTGVQRLAYPGVVIEAVYERMRSEREKEAEKIQAEGQEEAQKITVAAEKEASEIRAEAQKYALILKGEGDQESMAIYTEAYRQGGEFFNFLKSLETYSAILGKDTTMVVSTDSDLFKYLKIAREEKGR
ncbi:MAG: protease modulator HflC [Desulforhopalus sp.]|jgi:membrane protease subunit HflC|nr:protease modulator HflC [Desulforhopalus sp.]